MNLPPRRGRHSRRGGAYVLILGAATLLTVAGLGTIAVMRTSIARVSAARDWSRAGLLAESAVETGMSAINSDASWRRTFAGSTAVTKSTGEGGRMQYRIEDPADGDLTNNVTDSALLHGYGTYGSAKRGYSVRVQYVPPPSLDVLKYSAYAVVSCTTKGTVTATGGGLRTAAALTNSGTLTSDVWSATLSNSGSIAGEVRTLAVSLPILSDGSLPGYASSGTTINYSSLGGSIDKVLLSAASNPYGSPAANGIYVINVPALSTLTIRRSRIAATLIVQLGLTSTLTIRDEVNWEKGPTNLPVLIVLTTALSTVNLTGSTATLDESSVGLNLNPASTPYHGLSNTKTTDSYPNEIRGIIHVTGALANVNINTNRAIVGTVISEGSLSLDSGASITYDATVVQNPPAPYQTGSSSMMPVPGSWVWDSVP